MDPATSPLLTDIYQLNMSQAYLDHGEIKTAVFEFFVRNCPLAGAFLVAAVLAQALDFLENLRFLAEDVDWLAQRGRFGKGLLDHLASFPLPAMPRDAGRHGLFANEPILRGTAPLPTAQLLETRLINMLFSDTDRRRFGAVTGRMNQSRSATHRWRIDEVQGIQLSGVDADFDPDTSPLLIVAPGKARRAPDGPRRDRAAPAWSPTASIRTANPPDGCRHLENAGCRRGDSRSRYHSIGPAHWNPYEDGSHQ
jgi:hypothetical protein